MDYKTKILLNSNKSIDSVNVETLTHIELKNNKSIFTEYDRNKTISAYDVFYNERQANDKYRIYGRIEYMSLLNGINQDYSVLDDIFIKHSGSTKTLLNSFDFYLLKPSDDFIGISGTSGNYIRKMEVIATPDDFDIFEAGFTNNVYGDKIYSFNLNKTIDLNGYFDYLNFPITEIFLFAKYNKSESEVVKKSYFNHDSGEESFIIDSVSGYTIGDLIEVDLINFDRSEYEQTIITNNTSQITTTFTGDNKTIMWTYNPFIPIRLKYLSSNVVRESKDNSSYEIVNNIPQHAILLNPENIEDNTWVWREIIPQGTYDPITNDGVNYPFLNGNRYVFNTITIDVVPNINDLLTYAEFKNLKFNDPLTSFINPIIDINNIGKPCR